MRKPPVKVFKGNKDAYKNTTRERKVVPILDIPVDSTRKDKVLSDILRFLSSEAGEKLFIVTPNPEILVAGAQDPYFASILQRASLSLPDGIGVILAQKYISAPISDIPGLRFVDMLKTGLGIVFSVFFNRKWLFSAGEVVAGRVVFEELVAIAAQKGWRVCLLGGKPGVASAASRQLTSSFHFPVSSQFKIIDENGPWLNRKGEPADNAQAKIEQECIVRINKFKPHLLFVAFGHPKQEFWVHRHLSSLNVRVAMVVGGAFDYTAGIVPRVPQGVSVAGFEWLWRLITQRGRVRRVATALFVFPWLVFLSKLYSDKS
ncbi:MAG: WecB/TagA/CpsF family glycosyltransferase [Candidatus Blackburnbacteria bacterium]|nr:WecB/TagA/CpsF family glycosyltransferase [Candidatus Blackburnbacteria bacterium]